MILGIQKFKKFSQIIAFLAYIFPFAVAAPPNKNKFLAHIHVYECLEAKVDMAYDEIPLPTPTPLVLISICKIWRLVHSYRNFNETSIKPVPRYLPHSFFIRFDSINDLEKAEIFQLIYERLLMPSSQLDLIKNNALKYRKYWQYDANIFKKEFFLRSRWNLDEIIIHHSWGAVDLLIYNEWQFPTSLQKYYPRFKANNISELDLRYYVSSGYYHTCTHKSLYEKLQSLTFNFNAYDRIFCDTFERHGLQGKFTPYWNLYDIYHFRGRLLRDELLSSFPPDASNAVYYASPKLTFVVLQRNPITWQFVLRPFNKNMWTFLIVTYCLFEGVRRLFLLLEWIFEQKLKLLLLRKKIFAVIVYEDRTKLNNIEERHRKVIETFHALLRITVTSAYSGMILVSILNPIYPWTPETFAELNQTKNYYACTAFQSLDGIIEHLRKDWILNGVDNSMIMNRAKESPADFLVQEMENDEKDKGKFYASIMYDDKMNLYLIGRRHIYKIVRFLKKLKPVNDQVLPEMRYVSVAAGATKLHFLIDTLRWVFTAGTWMRWYYLEQNYYKNVVPVIVNRILVKELHSSPMKEDDESRPLNAYDLFSLFAIEGFGCVLAFTMYIAESWYAERCLMFT